MREKQRARSMNVVETGPPGPVFFAHRPAARGASLAFLAVLGATLLPAPSHAETIEQKAQLCAACHGENGIPQQNSTPVIWGQYQGYLYLELRDYKSGARKNPIMSGFAATLSEKDIENVAAYYSTQPEVLARKY